MTEDADLLERVRNTVLGLVTGLPRAPERLRVRARHVVVELDWPHAADAKAEPAPAAVDDQAPPGRCVTAPATGTLYRSPEPGAAPFVRVGDRVSAGQQVAIVEAMKVMLPVEADAEGVVTEVLVDDGQPVEYGTALFALTRD